MPVRSRGGHDASRTGRAHGQRGAAAVELVIILPLFLLLVFGGLTAALSYEHKAEVVQAVRDGARFGATTPLAQCDTTANCGGRNWAQLVQYVTSKRSGGALDTSQICVALVTGSTGTVYTRTGGVYSTGTTMAFPTAGCFDDGDADSGTRVRVAAVRNGDRINLVFSSFPVSLSSNSTAHYEQ